MNVLVLNNNEKFEEELIYLITQKRYNGKALDIAILNFLDINKIIGVQISIHKNDIFIKEQVS